MSDRAFLDTNILVYAHDSSTPDKQAAAQELIFTGLRESRAAISAQVLSEFFVIVTRKVTRPLSALEAMREIALLAHLHVVDIDSTLVTRAIAHVQRWSLSYWDGLILAAAERSQCTTIFSEDLSDGQSYGEVTVRNPFRA